jgi:hypothetical protein
VFRAGHRSSINFSQQSAAGQSAFLRTEDGIVGRVRRLQETYRRIHRDTDNRATMLLKAARDLSLHQRSENIHEIMGSILYGWSADAINGNPYFHTITQNATGTAA